MDRDGRTDLHKQCMEGETNGICNIMDTVGRERFKQHLLQPDRFHLTPLHLACVQGHAATIEVLLSNLDPQTKYKVALQRDVCGRVPLHLSCLSGQPHTALTMLHQLDDRTINEIILTKDNNENNPFSLADKSFASLFLSEALEQKKLDEHRSVKWLITVLSQRNKSGMSGFDYKELVDKYEKLLGYYADEFLIQDNSLGKNMFPMILVDIQPGGIFGTLVGPDPPESQNNASWA